MTIELVDLLEGLSTRTKDKFEKQPEVVDKDGSFDLSRLPVNVDRWHRLSEVVAVFFDLKSSTNLEKGRRPASTASIYDAGVGGVVKVFQALEADYVDIQGDGGFGLFWGEKRFERALCAAVTANTFSSEFTAQLEKKWPDAPSTGFKVGVASGPVLAKRVGLPRNLEFQAPVWAGRPVNYAAKAAQQTEPGAILITGSVWDAINGNDYLVFSCGCVNGKPDQVEPTLLWSEIELEKIPDEERFGQRLGSEWCHLHGEEFINAILSGQVSRHEVAVEAKSARNLLASGSPQLIEAQKSRAAARAAELDKSTLALSLS